MFNCSVSKLSTQQLNSFALVNAQMHFCEMYILDGAKQYIVNEINGGDIINWREHYFLLT
jgi:hypothetical protein